MLAGEVSRHIAVETTDPILTLHISHDSTVVKQLLHRHPHIIAASSFTDCMILHTSLNGGVGVALYLSSQCFLCVYNS